MCTVFSGAGIRLVSANAEYDRSCYIKIALAKVEYQGSDLPSHETNKQTKPTQKQKQNEMHEINT